MDWVEDFIANIREKFNGFLSSLQPWARGVVGLAIGVVVVIATYLVLHELAWWLASSFSYSYFFSILTTQGGVNIWLAKAICAVLASVFATGVYMTCSLKSTQRSRGWKMILATNVAFNLLVYACTRSGVAVEDGQNFVAETGDAKVRYYVDPNGDWELFPSSSLVHPRIGVELPLMTPDAAQKYRAWQQGNAANIETGAAERERIAKVEFERRYREAYINEGVIAASKDAANVVLLAVKSDSHGSGEDAFEGKIATLLKAAGKRPVCGAFKPAFFSAGTFDELWNGDLRAIERLRLLEGAPGCLLLCQARFSDPAPTSLEGLVSVQGSLSLVRVDNGGRHGPCEFRESGPGIAAADASANCAKRLINKINWGDVFPN